MTAESDAPTVTVASSGVPTSRPDGLRSANVNVSWPSASPSAVIGMSTVAVVALLANVAV